MQDGINIPSIRACILPEADGEELLEEIGDGGPEEEENEDESLSFFLRLRREEITPAIKLVR